MRFPRLRSAIIVGAVVGMAVPVIAECRYYFSYNYLFGRTVAVLWPSSIMLMATDGHENEPGAWVLLGITIAMNMILYACVTAMIWLIAWIIRRATTRTP